MSKILWIKTRCRVSNREMYLLFPPAMRNSPLGEYTIAVRCLFLLEFLAELKSDFNLPPQMSSLVSIMPLSYKF